MRATAQPDLTDQKTLYVEINRARDRVEFVTDDRTALRDRLEAATGEQISALKGIGAMERETSGKAAEAERADGLVDMAEWRGGGWPEANRVGA